MRRDVIPWMMAGGRAPLGPLMILGERCNWNGMTLAALVVSALFSDIFDGVLARRWRCDTAALRLLDSMADMVFYVCVAVALWLGYAQALHGSRTLALGLAAIELGRLVLESCKFGKPASYHSWLAKTWGLVLASAVISVFATRRANLLLPSALGLGIVSNLEGLAMSLVLPVWRHDVKGLAAALRIRAELRGSEIPRRCDTAVRLLTAILLVLLAGVSAAAESTDAVLYVGGTSAIAKGSAGTLDLTAPATLIFQKEAGGTNAGAAIKIPYARITTFEYHSEPREHLGVLLTIAASLVAPPQRKHIFSITYTDAADVVQVAVFEVSKRDFQALCAVLQGRSPAKCRGTCFTGAR